MNNVVPFKRKVPPAVYRFIYPAFVNLNSLTEAGVIASDADQTAMLWYCTTTPGVPTRFAYPDYPTAVQELDNLLKALTEYQQWVDTPMVLEGTQV